MEPVLEMAYKDIREVQKQFVKLHLLLLNQPDNIVVLQFLQMMR